MTASIDENLCMGCGLCAEICPEVFLLNGETATVGDHPFSAQSKEDCRDVKEQCPVNAISIST